MEVKVPVTFSMRLGTELQGGEAQAVVERTLSVVVLYLLATLSAPQGPSKWASLYKLGAHKK